MQLPVHLQAIVNVYSSEIPTKSPGIRTHPLKLANPFSGSTHPSSHLLLPVDCPVLSFSLDCFFFSVLLSAFFCSGTFCSALCFLLFWDLPFLVFFRSRGRSHAQALCVGFAPKQTKGSSEWHSPKPTQ